MSLVNPNWVGFSPDAKQVAVYYSVMDLSTVGKATETTHIRVWELANKGRPPIKFSGGESYANTAMGPPVLFCASSEYLISADLHDGIIKHDLKRGVNLPATRIRPQVWLDNPMTTVTHCSLWQSSDGNKVIRLLKPRPREKGVRIQIDTCQIGPPLKLLSTAIHKVESATALAVSPDHQYLAWAERGPIKLGVHARPRTIHFLNLGKGENRQISTEKPANNISTLAFSDDMRHFASGGYDGTLTIWDFQTGKEIVTLSGYETRVSSIAFSPDHDTVAYAGYDTGQKANVKLYSIKDRKHLQTWSADPNGVDYLSFDHSGSLLAVVSVRGVQVYKIEKPRQ